MKKQKLMAVRTDVKAGGFGDWMNSIKSKAKGLWSAAKAQAAKVNNKLSA